MQYFLQFYISLTFRFQISCLHNKFKFFQPFLSLLSYVFSLLACSIFISLCSLMFIRNVGKMLSYFKACQTRNKWGHQVIPFTFAKGIFKVNTISFPSLSRLVGASIDNSGPHFFLVVCMRKGAWFPHKLQSGVGGASQ